VWSSCRIVKSFRLHLTTHREAWIRSAYSCSFVSSRAVIASLEPAPILSSSLRVGSPRSLYFLRVPQEGFPATELASRRPGHCISTRPVSGAVPRARRGYVHTAAALASMAHQWPGSHHHCVINTRHALCYKLRATKTDFPQKPKVYFSDNKS